MEPTEAALLAVKGEIGELRGEMNGIGREIRDIKDLLSRQQDGCRDCRKGIDRDLDAQAAMVNARIDKQGERLTVIEKAQEGEKAGKAAVTALIDTSLGRISVCIGILAGSLSLIAVFVWPVIAPVLARLF